MKHFAKVLTSFTPAFVKDGGINPLCLHWIPKWLKVFCLFLIKMYQVFLSVHFGGACRWDPSCSCYAEQAILSYPLFPALCLIVKRLSRCHFVGPFGPDPLLKHRGAKIAP